jgi:hypothetical protein
MIRRASFILPLVLLLVVLPSTRSAAWGGDSHRDVTRLAVPLLPPELRPFFEANLDFIAERSVDPDLWRTAGFNEEPPRHFIDLDAYGAYPFPDLPRAHDLAVERFGRDFVEKNGVLPWRLAEFYGNLARAFAEVQKGTNQYALDNLKYHAAVLAHYVADAHVPFHAILNYDGQLTNQHGIHARFESELVRRFRSRITVRPVPIAPVAAPRDYAFDVLLTGFTLAPALLEADLRAIGEGTAYDQGYYDRFFAAAQPTLERRLAESAAGIAAAITGAWERAGRPAVPLQMPERVRTRRAATP